MRFVVFNKAFKNEFFKIWGKELCIGMTLQEAHANLPQESERLIELWKRCFEGSLVIEMKIGVDFYEIHGSPVFDENGNVIGAAHIAHNISSRVLAANESYLASQILEQNVEERTKELKNSHALLEKETQARKQVQHALEESEIRYRSLAEATNAVTWTWNENGQFSKAVPSWENFTGQVWPAYEHNGWLDAFPKEWQETFKQELQICIKSKSTYRTITKLWCKLANDFRYVLIHVTPIYRQHEKEIVEWVGAAVDIHALKQAEEDLRYLSWRLDLTLKSSKVGTWSLDIDNGKSVLDSATAQLFGVDWLEGSADQALQAIHKDDREAVLDAMKQCTEGHKMYDAEFRVVYKDGTVRYLGGRGELVKDPNTGKKVVFGINLDITERKQLEMERLDAINRAKEQERKRAEEAERNQKRQQEFVDTICHEIRNPLSGIVGGASLLSDDIKDAETLMDKLDPINANLLQKILKETKEHLESITKSATQQKAVVDDVLDMSRLVSNDVELSIAPVDLKMALPSLVQMFQPQVTLKALTLSLSLPEDDLFVSTDILRLNQIILNLLSNSVKFTEHGSISLKLFKQPSPLKGNNLILRFEVVDTGMGIPAEVLPKIFDKFNAASFQTRSIHGGTGLGLAISKRIVEAFGGTISATSQTGVGTCIVFTIPCKSLTPQEWESRFTPHIPKHVTVVSEPRNILIVEDNAVNQKILLAYLTRQNYCCQVAWNGAEALEKWNQYHFDLIFMDIEMPVMDGIKATQEIRHRETGSTKRVPIVGLSGNARQAQQQEALDAGMDDYLTKPYHRDEVYDLVSKYATRQRPDSQ